jgi:CubicO group peptidase (beta-lactamase class C family)
MSLYAGYLLSRRHVPLADITRRIPKHWACCSAGLRVSLCRIICLGTYLSLWVWKTHLWITDQSGIEMVLGGLNVTARDFAKIGEMFRNLGKVDGKQLVLESWVSASTHIESPHLAPGQVTVGGHKFAFGYGYQWWVPSTRTTIVKLSANPSYGVSENESDNKDEENLEMLRAITKSLS